MTFLVQFWCRDSHNDGAPPRNRIQNGDEGGDLLNHTRSLPYTVALIAGEERLPQNEAIP